MGKGILNCQRQMKQRKWSVFCSVLDTSRFCSQGTNRHSPFPTPGGAQIAFEKYQLTRLFPVSPARNDPPSLPCSRSTSRIACCFRRRLERFPSVPGKGTGSRRRMATFASTSAAKSFSLNGRRPRRRHCLIIFARLVYGSTPGQQGGLFSFGSAIGIGSAGQNV
jgi:hypothetical protein